MDNPSSQLIGGVFQKRIRTAGRVGQEFKAPQVASGASGVLAYASENATTWDRTETLPYVDPMAGGFGECELIVTFTGDGSQELPFAFPASDLRINGTAEANMVDYDAFYTAWVYGAWPGDNVQATDYDAPVVASFTSTYQLQWKIYFTYVGNITYYLKLRARGTCLGVLTVARTI
ncbi:hypothetical protein QFZ70_001528 [Arthrobacter sp. V1I9]|uniref:hypothetical protein n=1 Tax=Arthrobacter sp. V1I9 TaxID=3042275 RepID=UPI00278DEB75|nr:hypothetical protein [Arthrobacter sp. V1I9]MDQ0869055.1 hypothetical protein [Arthrobacter sp. V1I9]